MYFSVLYGMRQKCHGACRDPVLNKSSANAYEQDSVEIFMDENNDKATSYQENDVHYRVNYDNYKTTDAGDPDRFYTAAGPLTDNAGNQIGYIIESSLSWSKTPENNTVIGFEIQINDADASGMRVGTVNIFDTTNTAWSNPSSLGELIMTGKDKETNALTNPYKLTSYLNYVEGINPKGYINRDILTEPVNAAKKVLANPSATQEEINAALDNCNLNIL